MELPETVSNLRNLQTLRLNSCEKLRRLPQGLGKLFSLRHLEITNTPSLDSLPQGLLKLQHLQTLTSFAISEGGCQLWELGHLNNLHGVLAITNIKGVSEEASEAKLIHKKCLRLLKLFFVEEAYEGKSDLDSTALEFLEPHPNLEDLRIYDYGGSKFPTWMEPPTDKSKLTIYDCKNLEALLPFGKMKYLQHLILGGLDSVSPMGLFSGIEPSLSVAYPSLTKLLLNGMKYWEEWEMEPIGDTTVMPLLQKIIIRNCPKLKSLPHQMLSHSLMELDISYCPDLKMPYLPPLLEKLSLRNDAGSLLRSLPVENNASLKLLLISNSPYSTLPWHISELKALQILKIQDCSSLMCTVENFKHLTSLRELHISGCPILEEDWNILSHNCEIWINGKKIGKPKAVLGELEVGDTRMSNEVEAAKDELITDFNYVLLQRATKTFHLSHMLGRGGCGPVFMGFLEEDNTWIAVKIVERQSHDQKEFQTEVSALSNVTHPNLIRLRGHCSLVSEIGKQFFLVYDFFKNGSLDSWLFSRSYDRFLNWSQRCKIAMDVAKALLFLHRDCLPKQIIHLDVKPQNILVGDDMRGVLADFGMAKLINKEESTFQTLLFARGSPGYMAPEWSYGVEMSKSIDIFAYGKVLLDMFIGKPLVCFSKDGKYLDQNLGKVPLYQGRSLNFMKKKIQEEKVLDLIDKRLIVEGEANERMAASFVSIAIQCMNEDPDERPQDMLKVLTELEAILSEFQGEGEDHDDVKAEKSICDVQGEDHDDVLAEEECLRFTRGKSR